MRIVYDIVLFLYTKGILLASFLGNHKAKLLITGRSNSWATLSSKLTNVSNNRVWFHCASLGEFEQGRQLIEELKMKDPSVFIILSFFSPSGYESRKNYRYADLVCYLPSDTKKNAERFIREISPSYVIFIKYEFWLHFFEELKNKNIPLFMVSVIFRPSQIFFKWYGGFFRNVLRNVNYFFVQDEGSYRLLRDFGFTNCSVSGDTRFDRVKVIANESKKIDILNRFKQQSRLIIAGSTWPKDEKILLSALKYIIPADVKIVIAPHEVSENRVQTLIQTALNYFPDSRISRYSDSDKPELSKILIIDNIGLLSSIYSYGTIAWIGGGFGKGIHNILEAAAFGLPVLFGPNYKKFKEATDLVSIGGAIPVKNIEIATEKLRMLLTDEKILKLHSAIAYDYVNSHTGATLSILRMLTENINNKQNNKHRLILK